jgi:hypothetical protein
VFGQYARELRPGLSTAAGASLSIAGDVVRLLPRARLELRGRAGLSAMLAYGRTQQLAQSLRNPESLAGRVFPADLYLVAGAGGVPVARADQLLAAGTWQAAPGLRLELQAFGRSFDGVTLVAARETEPFALRPAAVGNGRATGAALELESSGARYRLLLAYGYQRVWLEYGDTAYRPSHGSTHVADIGLGIYPGATSLLRIALSGAAGRRGTAMAGPLEWETCNLLDQGCEFAGSPQLDGAPGGRRLPSYLRLDLGARKHWHLRVGPREAQVALFGTISNVLGRSNVLARVRDPDSGREEAIEMLPRTPLVLGLDWRF